MRKTKTKTRYQHDGVKTAPYKVEQLPTGKVEYRKIQAFDCCDCDGENAGYVQGTPEGDRWLVEKRIIPNDPTEQIKFKNVW